MKTITQEQKTKLIKLREQADELSKKLDDLFNQAQEITLDEEDGMVWDYIYNDLYDVDELLDKLGLEVSEN